MTTGKNIIMDLLLFFCYFKGRLRKYCIRHIEGSVLHPCHLVHCGDVEASPLYQRVFHAYNICKTRCAPGLLPLGFLLSCPPGEYFEGIARDGDLIG